MNRRMTPWIPVAVLLIPALILFGFTLWMGAVEYSPEMRDFTGQADLGGFFDRLTETVFLRDLFRSFLLRLLSLAAGCGLGSLIGLLLRRLPAPAAGVAVTLFAVLVFLPPQLLMASVPFDLISSPVIRCGAVMALPVLFLSVFCAAAFPDKMKKTAALLPLAAGAVFVLSADPDAVLAAGSGLMTLDSRAVSLFQSGFYTSSAQVSSLRILLECLLCLIPAVFISRQDTGSPSFRGSASGSIGCALTALAAACACLIPAFPGLSSAFSGPVFSAGLGAAAMAFGLSLAVSAAILLSRPRGRAVTAALCLALVMLSAFSAAKCALAEQASLSPAVTTGFFAAFSPLPLSLLLCLAALSAGGTASSLRGALACACLAAARGYSSVLPQVLGLSAPGSLPAAANARLLVFPLLMYVLCALLLAVFVWPAGRKKAAPERDRVVLSQGWNDKGRAGATSALPAASPVGQGAPEVRPAAPKAETPIETAVPARSNYTRQFVLSREPHETPVPSLTLAAEEAPAPAAAPSEPADPSVYSRPSTRPVPFESPAPAPVPREEEIPEGAPPSPAQIVSMINSLTRMRSLGIIGEEDYRDKYDRLMKLL